MSSALNRRLNGELRETGIDPIALEVCSAGNAFKVIERHQGLATLPI
mgnify:CR=1 FL=1